MGKKLNNKSYIIASILWVACTQASAEIHRYQDGNGKWHFTDNVADIKNNSTELVEFGSALIKSSKQAKPNTAAIVVPKNICKADASRYPLIDNVAGGYIGKDADVQFTESGPEDNPSFYFNNEYFAPVHLTFVLDERQNITASKTVPLSIEVPPQSKVKVVELKPTNPAHAWNYRYSYNYQIGTSNPRHDSNCFYLPPIAAGSSYRISQAFNGSFSHTDGHNRYAVDIAMPIGTDVVAARGGMVIDQDNRYVSSGLSKKYWNKANAIRILHADGTMAVYTHLQLNSIKFNEGEMVRAGQVIGRSGNTGYSSGPHLHFAIHANQNMHLNSIPFKFFIQGKPITPKRGMMLNSDSVL